MSIQPRRTTLIVILFGTRPAGSQPQASVSCVCVRTNPQRAAASRGNALPYADPPFRGVANRTLAGSKPDFPQPVKAPDGAPNVLLVLIDDAGFGNPSTFGGPCQTPTLDPAGQPGPALQPVPRDRALLADPGGAALGPQPSRRRLRLDRRVRGRMAGLQRDVAEERRRHRPDPPGQRLFHRRVRQVAPHSRQPAGRRRPVRSLAVRAGIRLFLRLPGRRVGPVRPGPDREQHDHRRAQAEGLLPPRGPVRPHDPLAARPEGPVARQAVLHLLRHRRQPLAAPRAQAVGRQVQGQVRPGLGQAPRGDVRAAEGSWASIPASAKLTPRDPAFPAWDSLSPDEKKLYARQMEVYAGFQENTDYQVGRVVKAIEEMGLADNTLIIYIWGDNGSSMEGTETGTFNELTTITGIPLTAEQQMKLIDAYGGIDAWGGPVMQPHFACAWAWAGNTPFQWGKQVASHFGGTRNPMVVSWPKRIKDKGGLRSQFTHVIDVAPTILEVAGISAPKQVNGIEQMPMHGVSFAYTFDDASAKGRHTQQYFEIFGNRAMYKDGWIACARLDRVPWKTRSQDASRSSLPGKWDPEQGQVGAVQPRRGFLGGQRPGRQASREAPRAQGAVLGRTPRNTTSRRCWRVSARSSAFGPPPRRRPRFTYYPGTENIGAGMIPPIYNRSFTITRRPGRPRGRCRGRDRRRVRRHGRLLALRPGRQAALHLQLPRREGRNADRHARNLPAGKVQVRYEFAADQPGKPATGGRGRLFIGDKQVGENHMEQSVPLRFTTYAGMDIGKDNGEPVSLELPAKSRRSPSRARSARSFSSSARGRLGAELLVKLVSPQILAARAAQRGISVERRT